MHATKLVNKKLSISFKKIQAFENACRFTSLGKERLYP